MPRSLFLLLTPALLTSALLCGACATADTSFDDPEGGGGSIGSEGGAAGDGGEPGAGSGGTAGASGQGGGGGKAGSAGGGGAGAAGATGGKGGSAGATGGAGQGGAGPKGACCAAHDSPGCADAAVEACVCGEDASCCQGDWNAFCVTQVAKLGCGSCAGGAGGKAGAGGAGAAGAAGDGAGGAVEPFGVGGGGQSGSAGQGGSAGTGTGSCSSQGATCVDCCIEQHAAGYNTLIEDERDCACAYCGILCLGFCAGTSPTATGLCDACLDEAFGFGDCSYPKCDSSPECGALLSCGETCP